MAQLHTLLACSVLILLSQCTPPPEPQQSQYSWEWHLPGTFDSLPPVPAHNAMHPTRVALGEVLFFDKRLSATGTLSCGSCHKPELAYADTLAINPGVHGRFGFRNSPSLLNVAYQKALFREGGIPSLEIQVLAPLGDDAEMHLNLKELYERLRADTSYQRMAYEAYGEQFSPLMMAQALAAFQRSLISSGSPVDAYLLGDSTALSFSAKRGKQLFYSDELACSSCHTGFLYTDMDYHNTGLYLEYSDDGRARITQREQDYGKMKTPSLRNVGITAPYMHDGHLGSLDEVLEHYNRGGWEHPNKDPRIRPLGLSGDELDDLKAFLISLTDTVLLKP